MRLIFGVLASTAGARCRLVATKVVTKTFRSAAVGAGALASACLFASASIFSRRCCHALLDDYLVHASRAIATPPSPRRHAPPGPDSGGCGRFAVAPPPSIATFPARMYATATSTPCRHSRLAPLYAAPRAISRRAWPRRHTVEMTSDVVEARRFLCCLRRRQPLVSPAPATPLISKSGAWRRRCRRPSAAGDWLMGGGAGAFQARAIS